MTAISNRLARQVFRGIVRSLRALGARLAPPRFDNLRLDGETPDGRHIHLALPRDQLRGGVALGRGAGEPYRIVAPGQGPAHVTLRLRGHTLYVRREGSARTASLNARALQAHRHEALRHGDWLCLEGQVLRLTLHRGDAAAACRCADSRLCSGGH